MAKSRIQSAAPVQAAVRRAVRDVARNKIRARKLTEEVRRRGQNIESELFAVGAALRKLSAEPMYTALGYPSFAALLKGERLLPKTTAYKLMAITQAFAEERAKALGVEKAYALLTYVEATPAADVADVLAHNDVRIGNRRVSQMTVRQIRDATRRVRVATDRGTQKSQAERDARSIARRIQAILRKQGAQDAIARAERHQGNWRIAVHVAVQDAALLTGG